MDKLTDKIALVTGAAAGIGRAIACLFAAQGASVMLADVSAVAGEETVAAIRKQGYRAEFIKVDVSQATEVENMVLQTVAAFGQLDILVNNAGIMPDFMALTEIPEEIWDGTISVNLKSVYLGMKYAIPQMLDRGGVIVNMASGVGFVGFPYQAAYGASKAAIIELTKTAAIESAGSGIRINCVCPGFVDTHLTQKAYVDQKMPPLKPPLSGLGRPGEPDEIAKAALFLACDDATFITGTSLLVDGGYGAI
jgi:NAD(P)-dependent dehydrogenase (short-subunit alcohol dehydrogenase family)